MASKKQPRPRHVPQRTCVVCRQKKDKRELTRLVRAVEGGIVVDPTGKLSGRGAYLCDDRHCWDKAIVGKALDKALRVEIDPDERQALAAFKPDSK